MPQGAVFLLLLLGGAVAESAIGAARGSDARLHGAHGRAAALASAAGTAARLHGAKGRAEPVP